MASSIIRTAGFRAGERDTQKQWQTTDMETRRHKLIDFRRYFFWSWLWANAMETHKVLGSQLPMAQHRINIGTCTWHVQVQRSTGLCIAVPTCFCSQDASDLWGRICGNLNVHISSMINYLLAFVRRLSWIKLFFSTLVRAASSTVTLDISVCE